MIPLLVLVGLLVVLVVFAGGMMIQERRSSGRNDEIVVYGVEESVDFVWESLSPQSREQLKRSDVRRILEWEMHYLQQPRLRDGGDAVVGGADAAAYAQERAWEAGHPYEPEAILEVMELQGRYLLAIGAVADPAGEEAGEGAE